MCTILDALAKEKSPIRRLMYVRFHSSSEGRSGGKILEHHSLQFMIHEDMAGSFGLMKNGQ